MFFFAACRASKLEINRLLGFQPRDPLEAPLLQHRCFQCQLRRKTSFDVLGLWRSSALVVYDPRAARSQEIDPVRPCAELERGSAFERQDKRALTLDPGLHDRVAHIALKGEEEVEAFFDVGPVERERRIVAEQRKACSRHGEEMITRLWRESAGRISLDKLLQRSVPGQSRFARPDLAFDSLERLQSENIFGVDRIRIATQSLDSSDAQGLRAEFNRGARRRSSLWLEIGGTIQRPRESEIKLAALF